MNEDPQLEQTLRLLEALLFRSAEPIAQEELVRVIPDQFVAKHVFDKLIERYKDRGISVVKRENAWVMITAQDLSDRLTIEINETRKLSRAALETLAIIAYYQPVTRAEIEEIRGVSLARTTLDQLLEARWIAPRGTRPLPGKPTLWVTTLEFMHQFGLEDLADLPMRAELSAEGLLKENDDQQPELFNFDSVTG